MSRTATDVTDTTEPREHSLLTRNLILVASYLALLGLIAVAYV